MMKNDARARNRRTTMNCNVIGAYPRVYCFFLGIWIILELVGLHFSPYSFNIMYFRHFFGPRKYVRSHTNALEILGNNFSGLWGVSGL